MTKILEKNIPTFPSLKILKLKSELKTIFSPKYSSSNPKKESVKLIRNEYDKVRSRIKSILLHNPKLSQKA